MATINPYLNFPGTSEEAFNFYKSVFGGEFSSLQRFKDTPEKDKIPAHEQEKIMHISLPIGKENILMATDALASMGHTLTQGNNMHISVNTRSKQEANQLFNDLSAGGQVSVPLDKMFWGDYFGMLTDRFGIHWMINFNPTQLG